MRENTFDISIPQSGVIEPFSIVENGDHLVGIYLNHTNNAIVEQNTYNSLDPQSSKRKFGIVSNGDGHLNHISNNIFSAVDIGISCQGDNLNLRVQCNNFGADGNPHPLTA